MTTFTDIKNQLQTLIEAANTATGNNDADLTTAVNALVGGYGSGGLSLTSNASGFVVEIPKGFANSTLTINGNLFNSLATTL